MVIITLMLQLLTAMMKLIYDRKTNKTKKLAVLLAPGWNDAPLHRYC